MTAFTSERLAPAAELMLRLIAEHHGRWAPMGEVKDKFIRLVREHGSADKALDAFKRQALH